MELAIVWDFSPELIEGFRVRWYGVLFALGFLLAYQVLQRILKSEGHGVDVLDGMTMSAFIGTVVGARLGHCLFYEPAYYLSNPIDILKIWEGGLASHGGTIGILIAFWVYARHKKFEYLWILSRAAIVTPIAGACIRLGNLANSEIYGHATDLPWGFVFIRAGETMPMHPTQIYEAAAYLAAFGLMMLYYMSAKKKAAKPSKNLLIGLFLSLIFGARFLIEFVKHAQVDFENQMPLNMGQLLSLPFVLAGIYFIYKHFAESRQNAVS
jgi:phosphatidylglycerol---prolipoprotein diacylglyceryl transferase